MKKRTSRIKPTLNVAAIALFLLLFSLITQTSALAVQPNVVVNPGFESGKSPWRLYTNGTGSFDISSSAYEGTNAAHITLATTGTNMQFNQTNISLEPNTDYELSFAAYSNTGHDLRVFLHKNTSPYTNYGIVNRLVNLTTSWAVYTISFTTDNFSTPVNDARLRFWFVNDASNGDQYWIDDVVLCKASGSPPPQFDLTVSVLGGNGTVSPTSGTYPSGTVVQLTAFPDTGYRVSAWSGTDDDSSTSNTNTVTMNDHNTVTVAFEAISQCQNAVVNPGFESGKSPWRLYTNGTGSFDISSSAYEGTNAAHITLATTGTNMQFNQTNISLEPNTDYELSFAAYSNTGHDLRVFLHKNTSPYTNYGIVNRLVNLTTSWAVYTISFTTDNFSTPVNDARLRFWFVNDASNGDQYWIDDVVLCKASGSPPPQFDLTVSVLGGNGTVSPTSGTYPSGTVVQLTAFPDTGYRVSAWSGTDDDSSTSNTNTVTMNDHKTVTVAFEEIPSVSYDLTCTVVGSYGTVSPTSGTYPSGTVVQLTAFPDTGYRVSAWSGTDDDSSTSNTNTVTMNDHNTVTVAFEAISQCQNAVVNPGFESGKSPWRLYTNGTGSFDISSSAYNGTNAAHITLATTGTNMQFNQTNISLEPNTDYELSFAAYSNTGHDLRVFLHKNTSPYTNYGIVNRLVNLTTSWAVYTISFTTDNFSTPVNDARLRFWFVNDASNGDQYWIDDVVLCKASGPPPPQYTLNVTTSGSGSMSLNPAGGVYAPGTSVELTGEPSAGWVFSGWSGDLSGTANPATLIMDADKNVTATFTANTAVHLFAGGGPKPGDVYKEFAFNNDTTNWRVTDPNAGNSGAIPYLPNPTLPLANLSTDDLQGAVKAELIVDFWGGHYATHPKMFRLNGNNWVTIPELDDLPTAPPPVDSGENYMQQVNHLIEVPVGQLIEGENTLEGTSGPNPWDWGQWGWYGVILRIYYDSSKPHATGQITSPVSGSTFADNPTITSSVSGNVNRVDFLAYYEGYDSDGDGVFKDWHRNYHRESWTSPISIRNHLGTVTSAPFQLTWDTQWIPDQPSGQVKFIARIRDSNDVWFVTDEVSNLTLQRTDFSVKLFKPEEVPQLFLVRDGQVKSSKVNISTLSDATSAMMYVATWNGNDGTDDFYSKVNSWTAPKYGSNSFYSYDQVPVPLSALTTGENLITFSSSTIHHGIEIMWPGPGIVVKYYLGVGSGPTTIDAWYGAEQTFGARGRPQRWLNVLGNTSDPDGVVSLTYSLNAGPEVLLNLGPDVFRLDEDGDFNIEIDINDPNLNVLPLQNSVLIRVLDAYDNETTLEVTVNYDDGNVWPESDTIDWSSFSSINDVAQVAQIVDGLWTLDADKIRSIQPGYDRLVSIGDIDPTWDNYEVSVPITVHSIEGIYGPPGGGPTLGLIVRWQGHTADGNQPSIQWWPIGAMGAYKWRSTYQRLEILDHNYTVVDNSGFELQLGIEYMFKLRVESDVSNSIYSLKVWPVGTPEPAAWTLVTTEALSSDQTTGSVLLVAQFVDASFGTVNIAPLP